LKVLGIAGSPRRGGNTDILLAEMMRGVAGKGAETKVVTLSNLSIHSCQHCDYCLDEGECKIRDDMQMIYQEMAEADVIVLASPVQFMGLTSEIKAMIDRCQAMWARKYVLKKSPLEPVKNRKGFFISVGGRKGSNIFEPALVTVKAFFRVLDVNYTGELLFPGIDEKGAIVRHENALKQVFIAGQDIVSSETV
jgi:multimeric flavodoxin WrbA